MFNEQERKFLIGLAKLTRETGIVIGGCGCCGSPSLSEFDQQSFSPEEGYGEGSCGEVAWLTPEDYGWEDFKHTIVKD